MRHRDGPALPSPVPIFVRRPAKSDALVPSLASWNPRWRYPTSGVAWWTLTPALLGFYDHVASSYVVVDVVGPPRWVIYARGTGTGMR